MKYFRNIFVFNEKSLNKDFVEKFKTKLDVTERGYGYWCWKPQVILQALQQIEVGECLIYMDAGCHLNHRGVNKLNEYVQQVESSDSGILAFELKFNDEITHHESEWTKGSVFDFFDVKNQESITNSAQICATTIILQKRPSVENFIHNWLKLFETNFNLFDDSLSDWNFVDFKSHRHDQSVFSIMSKINKIEIRSHGENYPIFHTPSGEPEWATLRNFPIQARRDKSTQLQKTKTAIKKLFTSRI